MKIAIPMVHGTAIRWPSFSFVFESEEIISSTLANVVFSQDIFLGRTIAVAMLLWVPEKFLLGGGGILLCHGASLFLSRNRVLNSLRAFEMNGWFLGLALATFQLSPGVKVLALISLAPVCALAVVVTDRLLKAWDLPVLVLPYCLIFWCLQVLGRFNPKLYPKLPPLEISPTPWFLVNLIQGSMRGFSQIFFSDNSILGAALLLMVAFQHRKHIVPLLVGALLPATMSYLVVGEHAWITSGLTSFTGILMTLAFISGKEKFHKLQLGLLLVTSGLIEMGVVETMSRLGLYALSVGYVVCFWVAKLGIETSTAPKEENTPMGSW